MVISARREKRGRLTEVLRDFEAQHVAVEADGAVEVGHLQVNVADPGLRMSWHDRAPPGPARHCSGSGENDAQDRGYEVNLTAAWA